MDFAVFLRPAAFSRSAWRRAALGPSPPIFWVFGLGMKSLMEEILSGDGLLDKGLEAGDGFEDFAGEGLFDKR